MINSRIFKRYLFSYLLVLFIPITIISFYIYSQFIQQFREAIMQSTTRILAQTRDTTDKHLESFANIASHASQNQHISFLMGHDHVDLVPPAIVWQDGDTRGPASTGSKMWRRMRRQGTTSA